jgi:tetraprenyl-beta-curcumene synthase
MASVLAGSRRISTSTLGDRRLVARAGLALVSANVRYWREVAPLVREELRGWERQARAIENAAVRAVALEKLDAESFNAEAAAMFATRVPREHRGYVVKAIVALELLFDYLDGLSERPLADPLGDGRQLFGAYTDAFATNSDTGGAPRERQPRTDDGGYLDSLSCTVSDAVAQLPAASAIAEVARRSAARGAEAQIRMHALPHLGIEQLEQWASAEARGTGLAWQDFLAGAASSVLALHALIAAAAAPETTHADAEEIESSYSSACIVLTLLDGLVDHDEDSSRAEKPAYIDLYENRDLLAATLMRSAQRAAVATRGLRDNAHHSMILVGVVAYYTSTPGAEGKLARPIVEQLQAQLAPLMSPTLTLVRTWRMTRRARDWRLPRLKPLVSPLTPSHTKRGLQ